MIHPYRLIAAIGLFGVWAFSIPAIGQVNPDGHVQKIINAYRSTETYMARRIIRVQGMNIRYALAFDRSNQRLAIDMRFVSDLVDAPELGFMVVVNNAKVRGSMDTPQAVAGHYLEIDAPESLNYKNLINIMPSLAAPHPAILPDLILLLADDPMEILSNGLDYRIKDHEDHITITTGELAMQIGFDPKTYLCNSTKFSLLVGDQLAFETRGDITRHNEELDAELFAFDIEAKQPVTEFEQLIVTPVRRAHPLEGKTTPDFTLYDLHNNLYTLSKESSKIIILYFWTTWKGACVSPLPSLNQLQQWAKDNNLPIVIQCVNVRENQKLVSKVWQKKGLSMSALIDNLGGVSDRFQVNDLPQTILIADGTIHWVNTGSPPSYMTQLKRQIKKMLDDGQKEQDDPNQ